MTARYDLVILDLAGTTVRDVGDPVAACLLRTIREMIGLEVPLASAVRVMGIPKPKAIAALLEEGLGVAEPDVVSRIHRGFVESMIEYYRGDPSVAEIVGTSEAFERMRRAGMKIGLNTGFSRDITTAIIERLGWDRAGLIDASVTSDEVVAGRPAPFMIHRAMALTGVVSCGRVVKVGDTPSDLWEGTNAGCGRVVGVCRGSHTRGQLAACPHTDLIEDVSFLPEALARSPRPGMQLHTPGPANTSEAVRAAMSRDIGAWDRELIEVAADVRNRVLAVGALDVAEWDCVLFQGSGTFAVEAAIGAAVPVLTDDGLPGRLLVASNGAYGDRMVKIARAAGIAVEEVRFAEDEPVRAEVVAARVAAAPEITTVAVVHCETTTGIMNDVVGIGRAVRMARNGRDVELVVDAMSSFGAYGIDVDGGGIDWLVASSNKCLQGVPGIGCVLGRRSRLEASSGRARSLSLDVHDQWRGLETHGRFRFTPPTHVLLAFQRALMEHCEQGGVAARRGRYEAMHRALVEGLEARGYVVLIEPQHRSGIITTVKYPAATGFNFPAFYECLHRRGFVIYPGKLSKVDCFRVGHIGDLTVSDIGRLLAAFDEVAEEMGFSPAELGEALQAAVAAARLAEIR